MGLAELQPDKLSLVNRAGWLCGSLTGGLGFGLATLGQLVSFFFPLAGLSLQESGLPPLAVASLLWVGWAVFFALAFGVRISITLPLPAVLSLPTGSALSCLGGKSGSAGNRLRLGMLRFGSVWAPRAALPSGSYRTLYLPFSKTPSLSRHKN